MSDNRIMARIIVGISRAKEGGLLPVSVRLSSVTFQQFKEEIENTVPRATFGSELLYEIAGLPFSVDSLQDAPPVVIGVEA